MKKKIIGLTLIAMLIGGGITYAAVNHIADKKQEVKASIDTNYQEYQEEKSKMVHSQVEPIIKDEVKRLEKEVMDYYWERQYGNLNQATKEKTKEVKRETNKSIEELKKYIDELFNGKNGGRG